MNKYTKNTLKLDIKIKASKSLIVFSCAVIVVVLLLCAAVSLSIWQWLVLALLGSVLLMHIHWRQKHRVHHISTDEIDGVWLLAKMDTQLSALSVRHRLGAPTLKKRLDQAIIHQAYLHDIDAVALGITQAVILDFYVILPKKQRLRVVIFQDQLTARDFSQLMALARLRRGMGV